MKKILATILAVAMLATTFVGCGNGGETASTPSDDGGAAAPKSRLVSARSRRLWTRP